MTLIKLPAVQQKILSIRDQHIMLDRNLAELYGVPTKVLNQAMQRNKNCFPPDFVFQLNKEEWEILKSQIVISRVDDEGLRSQFVTSNGQVTDNSEDFENWKSQSVISNRGGQRYRPYAFIEQGVAMLSSVLRSSRAAEINVAIMRGFVEMRRLLLSHADLARRLDALEAKYDRKFNEVFAAIRQLMMPVEPARKQPIGFVPHQARSGAKNPSGQNQHKQIKMTKVRH